MANTSPAETPEQLFGRRVREERRRRGWHQADLAASVTSLGVPLIVSSVSKSEAGTRPIRLNEAAAIATAFGMVLSQLLTDSDAGVIEAELRQVRAELAEASAASDAALERAVMLRNRERQLIVALGDSETRA